MFNFKKTSCLSVELNDYVLRGLVKKGPDSDQWQVVEVPLPKGVVQDASITDEMALFDIMKANLLKLGGKNQNVRIFVPDTSVLLKVFEHPADVKSEKLLEYVQMELGRSIHLPFQEPLIDVYDHKPDDGVAVLFAVPPDEVGKLMGILQDINMHPEAVDIRALCNLRLLEQMGNVTNEQTYLIADWSINELSICIYSFGQVEFLRFQTINTDMNKWRAVESEGELTFEYDGELDDYRSHIIDQVLELDRIQNFFKFSLHKGEKSVDEMILMGDNSLLQAIYQIVSDNVSTPLTLIDDASIQKFYPQLKAKHASLIGLALKEV